ncbi:MAG: pyridoxamine 5'-phosphate oxidase family protein, partial [Chloroflexi bacterium]|nr:pyridoxamine 5'-phosphate oxidase family protein [Chloroflexota bacterium]
MSDFAATTQNRLRRIPARGHYDKAVIYPIIDEALICHVGFVEDGLPYVIPTIHARSGDKLIFHGAKASRMMKQIASGATICVTFTLLDGLLLARSTFHHSMNYRSVVLFGQGRPLTDEAEKMAALEVLTEHLAHGRWPDSRQPNAKELKATAVAELTIASASAKIRTGPPGDDEEDYALPIWAGILPIRQQYLPPIDDPQLSEG